MKAEIERDIIAAGLENTHIFRPSMILGKRKANRPLEKFLIGLWSIIGVLFIGSLSRFRGISADDIAGAMVAAARTSSGKIKIYEWKEMKALL